MLSPSFNTLSQVGFGEAAWCRWARLVAGGGAYLQAHQYAVRTCGYGSADPREFAAAVRRYQQFASCDARSRFFALGMYRPGYVDDSGEGEPVFLNSDDEVDEWYDSDMLDDDPG